MRVLVTSRWRGAEERDLGHSMPGGQGFGMIRAWPRVSVNLDGLAEITVIASPLDRNLDICWAWKAFSNGPQVASSLGASEDGVVDPLDDDPPFAIFSKELVLPTLTGRPICDRGQRET